MILGLIMAYTLNALVAGIIFTSSVSFSSYDLHYSAIIVAVGVGKLIGKIENGYIFIRIIINYL